MVDQFDQIMLKGVILLPFLGAFIIQILPPKRALITGLFFLLVQFICSFPVFVTLVGFTSSQQSHNSYIVNTNFFNILFRCDVISLIFVMTSIFVGVVIYLFSLEYFKKEKVEEERKFSFWGLVFIGSMMGVVLSENLISLYFFWELAGL